MTLILIGIDDTDNYTSRGTGRLARLLSGECEQRDMHPLGVTRHQFLLDPAIRYTSHNSGACVAVASNDGVEAAHFAFDFVAQHAAKGSDPGVCVAWADAVEPCILEFGDAATCRVLTMEDALSLAKSASITLRGLGGSGEGVIGALASVGLRAGGNKGRLIDLPGLRDLPPNVDVQTYERMGIAVQHEGHRRSGPIDRYDNLGWVRPRLVNGKPVLVLEWSEQRNAWIPIDRKRNRPPR